MGEQSVIIIDEYHEPLHRIGIHLTGRGFRLATSDSIEDAIRMFQLRDIPGCIFLSDTIPDRKRLIAYLRERKGRSYQLIPIREKTSGGEETAVYRPYKADDFLTYIS